MTGPEHFRRAEQLAEKAQRHLGQEGGEATAAAWSSLAQVHATLALAAASRTAEARRATPGGTTSSRAAKFPYDR